MLKKIELVKFPENSVSPTSSINPIPIERGSQRPSPPYSFFCDNSKSIGLTLFKFFDFSN